MNCKRSPFDDINLRRAVAWALDRDTLVQQAYFGRAQKAYTPISPPMTEFFDPDIATSGRGQWFDLERQSLSVPKRPTRAKSKPCI